MVSLGWSNCGLCYPSLLKAFDDTVASHCGLTSLFLTLYYYCHSTLATCCLGFASRFAMAQASSVFAFQKECGSSLTVLFISLHLAWRGLVYSRILPSFNESGHHSNPGLVVVLPFCWHPLWKPLRHPRNHRGCFAAGDLCLEPWNGNWLPVAMAGSG